MTPKQTAKILDWVKAKKPEGHRKVCIHHMGATCPVRTRVREPNTTTEERLAPCTCQTLLLRLETFVYWFDVKQETFGRFGEYQDGVVRPFGPAGIPEAIRR